ncbi:OmpA family protein [Kineosporia babensis]|uniref:OmpA family protein n=1 Tax=Kineosporia babensis TaxID=499548 RepID=A0A9X1NKF6_9ACTN|nr:OmpA family protein [Kineosporia babensis]MCD5315900.1 OmpA family protein [Kineosporia babensis]
MSGGVRMRGVAAIVAVGLLPVVMVASPAAAAPVGDAQLVTGEVFLTNGYVEVGSRANGSLGSTVSAPAGYHPRNDSGTILGFRSDRDKDGWGVGTDDGDFFTPGNPYEGWGFQVGDSGTPQWNDNSTDSVAGSYATPTLTGTTAAATWSSTAPVDGISVSQVITAAADKQALDIDVTLTNTTGSAMTNVYYARGVDPDNCATVTTPSCDGDGDGVADTPGSYYTRNTIVAQVGAGDPASVASATQTDGSYLDLRSVDTDSLAAIESSGCTNTSNLAQFYPGPGGSACTTVGSTNFRDGLIYQVIKTPTLAAGASRTLHLQYTLSAAAATGSTPQAITFPQPADTPLSSGSATLTASADSSLAVTYTSSTPAICTVSGSTLTLVALGTCTITAKQPGNLTYAAATDVTRSFAVVADSSPVRPTPPDLSSTGVATAVQQAKVTIPEGGNVTLLDAAGEPTTTVTVSGVGVYTLNPSTGVITFAPERGYSGTTAGVRYQVASAGNLKATALYTATVRKPAAPAPKALTSTGPAAQRATIAHREGDVLALLDSAGTPSAGPVTIAGEGTYELDPATGVITFTPERGFTGKGVGIGFQVTDAYEQTGMAAYVPSVGATPTPPPTPTKPGPGTKPLPKIDRSHLVKIPADPTKVRGKHRRTKAFNSASTGADAHPITKLGSRQLAKGQGASLSGDGLFNFNSARLTKKGRAQVKSVVKNLRGAEAVRCEGYTDYAGLRSHELRLSAKRAKAVCTALKMYGAEVRTKIKGFGPERPAVIGGTPEGRRANRRVVILVTR